MNKNPYEVLGVPNGSSFKVVKEAYLNLAKKYHPDNYKNHPLESLAVEKMQEINEAYESLSNPNYNGQYNKAGFGSGSGTADDPYVYRGGAASQANSNYSRTANSNGNNNFNGNYGESYNFTGKGNNYNRPDNNFYSYRQGRGLTGGGCCSDLCACCVLDSCCECMGGDLCTCC